MTPPNNSPEPPPIVLSVPHSRLTPPAARLSFCRWLRATPMHMSREIVHTLTDYYDGPRGGIADYHGKPHIYSSFWDETTDDWSDTYLLQPLDDETFHLAMEDWAIWCRWERAYHSGQTPHATHPALPDERARHDEISAVLTPKLQVDPKQAIRVQGKFEARTPAQSAQVLFKEKFVVV